LATKARKHEKLTLPFFSFRVFHDVRWPQQRPHGELRHTDAGGFKGTRKGREAEGAGRIGYYRLAAR
jgi:hypothetical protein